MNKPQAPSHDDSDPNSLTVEQALERIRASIAVCQGFEQLSLRSALGRALAEAILSPINVPAYANSAMDGYAVLGADLPSDGETELRVIGTAFAGHPYEATLSEGQAVRIMTGAKMPEGADTVVMQEHVVREGDTLRISSGHKAGQNVRQAGEDLTIGQIVLVPGKHINPAEMGLLASLGIPEVKVTRRLRVAFFSTGDELASLGQPLKEGQIYDSNRYTLHGMLQRLGIEIIDMGVIPDDRAAIRNAFAQASEIADVLITSGGVSVGDADYVKETLDTLGQVNFWKIAMKPGRPLAFGQVGKAVFFGLPGNPVSAMATFYQVVQPALRHMMGQQTTQPMRLKLPCVSDLKKRPGRVDFQRGIISTNETGQLVVRSTGHQGSHILSSMSQANCFIILPADSGSVEAGSEVIVEPFDGLI